MNGGAVVRRCCHSAFDDDETRVSYVVSRGVADVGVEGRKIAGPAAGGNSRRRPSNVGGEGRDVG